MVSKRWAQASIAFLVAGAAIGAACGGDDEATPTPTPKATAKAATPTATAKAVATTAAPKATGTTVPAVPATPKSN